MQYQGRLVWTNNAATQVSESHGIQRPAYLPLASLYRDFVFSVSEIVLCESGLRGFRARIHHKSTTEHHQHCRRQCHAGASPYRPFTRCVLLREGSCPLKPSTIQTILWIREPRRSPAARIDGVSHKSAARFFVPCGTDLKFLEFSPNRLFFFLSFDQRPRSSSQQSSNRFEVTTTSWS